MLVKAELTHDFPLLSVTLTMIGDSISKGSLIEFPVYVILVQFVKIVDCSESITSTCLSQVCERSSRISVTF